MYLLGFAACFHTPSSTTAIKASVSSPPLSAEESSDDIELFIQWISGEFSNHEQVLSQKFQELDNIYAMTHHYFVPIQAPLLGQNVLYVQQEMQETGKSYRQRIYTLETGTDGRIVMKIYKFKDPAAVQDQFTSTIWNTLSREELIPTPGCEVYWERKGDSFSGSMIQDSCQIQSERSGKQLIFNDDLMLNANSLWIRDVATDLEGNLLFGDPNQEHHKNRKMLYYTGWSVIKDGGPNSPKDAPWNSFLDLQLHNEGGKVTLKDENGKDFGYSIELARLTRSKSNTYLLKLALIDDATGKTKAYTWSDPESSMIGFNIGWAQIGLRLEETTPSFGFDTPQEKLIDVFSEYLEGHFDSSKQASEDQDYYSVHLQMCRVDAPDIGSHVFYVEQAIESSLDEPYRQRLYKIEQPTESSIRSSVLELEDPKEWIGACNQEQQRSVQAHQAAEKVGCHVDLEFDGGLFKGKTGASSCPSTLRGSSYATSEIVMGKDRLEAWDRGFDQDGTQVWGAEKGAYIFQKQQ